MIFRELSHVFFSLFGQEVSHCFPYHDDQIINYVNKNELKSFSSMSYLLDVTEETIVMFQIK
jgi:hypothetical protein